MGVQRRPLVVLSDKERSDPFVLCPSFAIRCLVLCFSFLSVFLFSSCAPPTRSPGFCSPLDDSGDEDDGDGENSDGEDGVAAPKRQKRTSPASRESAGRGGKAKASPTAASAAAAGDMSTPDLVEDLGAWSDDEWA